MKKVFALFLAVLLVAMAGCAQMATQGQTGTDGSNSTAGNDSEEVTINVYNWGQYIAEGDEGAMDVIAEFEATYPNIHVNYTTYDSNETMYSKLKTGGISVDVIIPSDYMIARLIDEDMLLPWTSTISPTISISTRPIRTPPMTRTMSTPSPTPGVPWASFTTPNM